VVNFLGQNVFPDFHELKNIDSKNERKQGRTGLSGNRALLGALFVKSLVAALEIESLCFKKDIKTKSEHATCMLVVLQLNFCCKLIQSRLCFYKR
jgi:hypothetical protein